jgi:hypothetical protein
MLILAMSDGTNRRLIGSFPLAAGSATAFASGTIAVNFVIAPGYKLTAAHNVEDSGSSYVDVDFVPFGGVVRAPGVLYGSALPDADVFYRGKTFTVFSGTGVADASYVCMKLGDESYTWFPIGRNAYPAYDNATLPDPAGFPTNTPVINTDTSQLLATFDNVNWSALS